MLLLLAKLFLIASMLSPTLAKLFSVNLQITVKVVVVVAVLVVMTRLTIDNQEKYFMIILLDLRFYLNFA